MKIREKSPLLREMITGLEKGSREHHAPVWRAVARGLNKPRRQGFEVRLFELEKAGENAVVVPGTVLGEGELTRPLQIAALRFSGRAREKIEKAGGKALTIRELAEQNPSGKGIRIMG